MVTLLDLSGASEYKFQGQAEYLLILAHRLFCLASIAIFKNANSGLRMRRVPSSPRLIPF